MQRLWWTVTSPWSDTQACSPGQSSWLATAGALGPGAISAALEQLPEPACPRQQLQRQGLVCRLAGFAHYICQWNAESASDSDSSPAESGN